MLFPILFIYFTIDQWGCVRFLETLKNVYAYVLQNVPERQLASVNIESTPVRPITYGFNPSQWPQIQIYKKIHNMAFYIRCPKENSEFRKKKIDENLTKTFIHTNSSPTKTFQQRFKTNPQEIYKNLRSFKPNGKHRKHQTNFSWWELRIDVNQWNPKHDHPKFQTKNLNQGRSAKKTFLYPVYCFTPTEPEFFWSRTIRWSSRWIRIFQIQFQNQIPNQRWLVF